MVCSYMPDLRKLQGISENEGGCLDWTGDGAWARPVRAFLQVALLPHLPASSSPFKSVANADY